LFTLPGDKEERERVRTVRHLERHLDGPRNFTLPEDPHPIGRSESGKALEGWLRREVADARAQVERKRPAIVRTII